MQQQSHLQIWIEIKSKSVTWLLSRSATAASYFLRPRSCSKWDQQSRVVRRIFAFDFWKSGNKTSLFKERTDRNVPRRCPQIHLAGYGRLTIARFTLQRSAHQLEIPRNTRIKCLTSNQVEDFYEERENEMQGTGKWSDRRGPKRPGYVRRDAGSSISKSADSKSSITGLIFSEKFNCLVPIDRPSCRPFEETWTNFVTQMAFLIAAQKSRDLCVHD